MRKIYNSFLFIPANQKLLCKIPFVEADAVIVDLEDAILPAKKDEALNLLKDFLKENHTNKDVFVRINPDRANVEIEAINEFCVKGYMIPKTESAGEIRDIKALAGDRKIIALVESPKGLLNIEEIVKCYATDMVAFGAEDYTTACSIKNSEEYLVYPKSKIVAFAKAYDKICIDTISLNIDDEEAYIKEAQSSKNFGFDAKLSIHPMQVKIINKVFSQDSIEYYKEIVSKYDECGEGILKLDKKVFEKPHIDKMRKIIRESENEN